MHLASSYYQALANGLIRAQYATEARKACLEPGISISFMNVYTDAGRVAVARLSVQKPNEWIKEVIVDQVDIAHIRENATFSFFSDAALEKAKIQIAEHTHKIIEEDRQAFDKSFLGRTITWLSGPK